MVSFPEQDWHVAATIWGCSPRHFHIECPVSVSPGMTISLFVICPGTDQAIRIEEALVTWAGRNEFGIAIERVQPSESQRLFELVNNHAH